MRNEKTTAVEDVRTVLEPIIHRNSGRWQRFIAAILKSEEDAEDVIQEAVRRVLARNRPLPSQEEARMYLGRAIGNSALELYHVRKRERLRQIPIKEHLLLPVNTRCPYSCIEERERSVEREKMLGLLNEGLMRLPMKQHEALRLTILESRGLSIREIGNVYGIPYSTLRHRSKQGLLQLRRFLEKEMKQRSQETGVRSQKTKDRSQETGVRSQNGSEEL